MTHTPGPWKVDTDPTAGPYILAKCSAHIRGTIVTHGDHVPNIGRRYWPAVGDGGISIEEVHANARLCAAAPDLLAALQAVCECLHKRDQTGIDWYAISVERMSQAHAAIAKAEGGAAPSEIRAEVGDECDSIDRYDNEPDDDCSGYTREELDEL